MPDDAMAANPRTPTRTQNNPHAIMMMMMMEKDKKRILPPNAVMVAHFWLLFFVK